jgi:nitrate reductase (cytochrome)
MSPLDRRAFLRGVAAAAAGSAVAPGTLVTAQAAGRAAAATDWHRTACQLCPVGCGLLVRVQNGRATAAKGDPDSPVSAGLACARGYHAVQALYGRDRITQPLIRRAGRLQQASLGDALDLVADRLRRSIAQGGPDSAALYGAADWSLTEAYTAAKLFKGGIGTNNVDTEARLYSASASAGLVSSFGLDGAVGCLEDVDHADVIVIWDENIAETAPALFSRVLARRRSQPGARVIDLATRTTRTSYAADRSLLHAPQSQLALANAVCHELVARGRINRDFVERHVAFRRAQPGAANGGAAASLVEDDGVAASWSDLTRFLDGYAAERVEPVTGVPAADVRWLAGLYADRSLRVLSIWGAGVNRHPQGTWLNNALHNIHLLVGKVATPGNGALCATAPSAAAGAMTQTLPRGSVTVDADRARAASIWGVPLDRLPARPGHSALDMFRAVERGALGFLWIQSADPLGSLPNQRRYRRAVASSDCFVVVSTAYPTPTSDAADVVLPSALWLERDAVRETIGRRLHWTAGLVPPPGAALGDDWQLVEVARRLGLAALFPWTREEHAGAAWDEYRRFQPEQHTRLPTRAALAEGTLWPAAGDEPTRWRYHAAHDPAADRARGAFDFYGRADHRARIWLRPHEAPVERPDREYPYTLVTGDVLEHAGTGTLTRRIPALHRAVPRAYAELNAEDARTLGVRTGDMVRLSSRRGVLELEARVDHRSQPPRGLVFVPAFDELHPANVLTLDASCPVSGQPVFGGAVRIERAARQAGA